MSEEGAPAAVVDPQQEADQVANPIYVADEDSSDSSSSETSSSEDEADDDDDDDYVTAGSKERGGTSCKIIDTIVVRDEDEKVEAPRTKITLRLRLQKPVKHKVSFDEETARSEPPVSRAATSAPSSNSTKTPKKKKPPIVSVIQTRHQAQPDRPRLKGISAYKRRVWLADEAADDSPFRKYADSPRRSAVSPHYSKSPRTANASTPKQQAQYSSYSPAITKKKEPKTQAPPPPPDSDSEPSLFHKDAKREGCFLLQILKNKFSLVECVCDRPDAGGMLLQCEQCYIWQHAKCVNLKDGVSSNDEFYCSECREENEAMVATGVPFVAPPLIGIKYSTPLILPVTVGKKKLKKKKKKKKKN